MLTIGASSQIFLVGGRKIRFDYCFIATGESYNSHPWLNHLMPKMDSSQDSPLSKIPSTLDKTERSHQRAFEVLSGLSGVDIFLIRDFLAHSEQADLFRLAAALLSSRSKEAARLRKDSKVVSEFLASLGSQIDLSTPDLILQELKATLSSEVYRWATRGQIREEASDKHQRTRSWRLQQLDLEHQSLDAANSVLVLGGGVIAIETASDLADRFPGKSITILHRGTALYGPLMSFKVSRVVLLAHRLF